MDRDMNQNELKELEAYINLDGSPDTAIQSPDVKKELFKIIAAVPQIGVIELDHAMAWVEELIKCPVKAIFGEEHMLWHAKRLNGIGGSEIGTIVAHRFDYDDPFTTRMDIIRDKLMMTPPTEFSEHTLRGNLLEDIFDNTVRDRIIKHTKGFEPIDNFETVKRKKHPWLVGNPDFPYYITGKSGKRLFIDDFKIPGKEKCENYAEGELPLGYIAQVHHYALCAGDEGRNAGLGLLSYNFGLAEKMITEILKRAIELNYFEDISEKVNGIAKMVIDAELKDKSLNIYGAGMHREKIQPSQEMFDAILQEGDVIWETVQQGYQCAKDIEHDNFNEKKGEIVCEGSVIVADANYLSLLKKSADNIYKTVKEKSAEFSDKMAQVSSKKGVRIGNVLLSAPSKSKVVSNRNRCLDLLKTYGIKESEVSKVDDGLLIDRLTVAMGADALRETGAIFIKEGSRVMRFPTSRQAAYKEMKPQINEVTRIFESGVAESFAEFGVGYEKAPDTSQELD